MVVGAMPTGVTPPDTPLAPDQRYVTSRSSRTELWNLIAATADRLGYDCGDGGGGSSVLDLAQ
jgi:hypothetical protein